MPTDSVELHRVRAAGLEDFEQALEGQLVYQQWMRAILKIALFSGSVLMIVLAFMTMKRHD